MTMLSNISYRLDEVETGNKKIVIKTSEASLEQGRYLLGVREWISSPYHGGGFAMRSVWYFACDVCPYLAAEGLGRDELIDGVRLV